MQEFARAPLFLIGFARSDVRGGLPELLDLFDREIELASLDETAATELARSVLGPDERVEDIVARAAGNAFFLEELLRARLEGRAEMPEMVQAMLLARFEKLTAEARRELRAASLIGPVFWRGAVETLVKTKPSLDLLERAEIVSRRRGSRFPGEEEWVFRHAMVREAAYGMLTQHDRVLGHAIVAEWLEAHGETDAAVLAEHHERGGRPEHARPWWARAAAQAMERGDLRTTVAHVERARKCGASGEALGALHLLEAAAQRWGGRNELAQVAAQKAIGLLVPQSDAWCEALGELAMAAGALGHHDIVLQARDALLAYDHGSSPAFAIALAQVATTLLLVKPDEAAGLLERASRIDRGAIGDHPLVDGYLERLRGFAALTDGDVVEYFEAMRSATDAFHRAGDRRNACVHAANAGFGAVQVGAWKEAAQLLGHAREWARGLGIWSVGKKNLARLQFVTGHHDEAILGANEAAIELGAAGHLRLESYAHAYASQALLAKGDLVRARASAERAIERASRFPGARANALASLARIQLAAGDLPGALAASGEAMALFQSLGALEDGETLVRLARAEALAAAGDRVNAAAVTRDAVSRLASIHDRVKPEWRASFRQMPEVAATLALAERLGLAGFDEDTTLRT